MAKRFKKYDENKVEDVKPFYKVVPRSPNQQNYINEILKNDITICSGIPGTGKTMLAVGIGVELLGRNAVDGLMFLRPVVESKDSKGLGYLPGTMEEKLEPYIRPIMDELMQMVNQKYVTITELINNGKNYRKPFIQIGALEYLRGITLKNTYCILDEAQNATYEQLKMVLTRLGPGSKIVINGDVNQSDIKQGSVGLRYWMETLRGLEGVGIVELTASDMVRHELISRILERHDENPFHSDDPKPFRGRF